MYKKHISGLVSTCTGDTAYLLDILQEHYDPWDLHGKMEVSPSPMWILRVVTRLIGWSAWPKNGWYVGSFGCVWKWGLHPVSTAQKGSKRIFQETLERDILDSQLAWFSMLFPAAYHFLYSLPFPAVLPQKSWCPAQGQMVGLNHAAWNTESFRANHITFRRSWSNFWGI